VKIVQEDRESVKFAEEGYERVLVWFMSFFGARPRVNNGGVFDS